MRSLVSALESSLVSLTGVLSSLPLVSEASTCLYVKLKAQQMAILMISEAHATANAKWYESSTDTLRLSCAHFMILMAAVGANMAPMLIAIQKREKPESRLLAYCGSSQRRPTITCRLPLNKPVPKAMRISEMPMAAMATVSLPRGSESTRQPMNIMKIPVVTIRPKPNLSAAIPPMIGRK